MFLGTIRSALAVTVVFGHAGLVVLVGGQLSVQLFFVISGYLISFVLAENRTYSSRALFWWNRAIRIFPLYFVIVGLTIAAHAISLAALGRNFWLENLASFSPLSQLLVGITNITIVGQDLLFFIGSWEVFGNSPTPLHAGLLVPQAWSIALELAFYALAPFILRTKFRILLVFLIASSIRILGFATGFGLDDPWSYRFFPMELGLFLIGAISHQYLSPVFSKLKRGKKITQLAALICSLLALWFFDTAPIAEPAKTLLLFALFAFVLPSLFQLTSANRFDKFLGDLSYPIYISHMLVLWVSIAIFQTTGTHFFQRPWGVVILTILFSILLLQVIEKPIQIVRARIRSRS